MKRPLSLSAVLGAVVCLAYGCTGDDDAHSSAPHAGTAGKGGGKGGAGGSSAGGESGGAGRGGNGGGGRGGGSAGEAGNCAHDEQPRGPLAECPPVLTPDGDQGTVPTTCTFEATCRELACGNPWSEFDEYGCRRPQCRSSSECGAGERCLDSELAGVTLCFPSVYEECVVDGCDCWCGSSDDCRETAFCQPPEAFPVSFECPVATVECADLRDLIRHLARWTDGLDSDDLTELDREVLACQAQAEHQLAHCNGEGGAGAGGHSGASSAGQTHGGQSGAGQAGGP